MSNKSEENLYVISSRHSSETSSSHHTTNLENGDPYKSYFNIIDQPLHSVIDEVSNETIFNEDQPKYTPTAKKAKNKPKTKGEKAVKNKPKQSKKGNKKSARMVSQNESSPGHSPFDLE